MKNARTLSAYFRLSNGHRLSVLVRDRFLSGFSSEAINLHAPHSPLH